jgi:hypothetical protein
MCPPRHASAVFTFLALVTACGDARSAHSPDDDARAPRGSEPTEETARPVASAQPAPTTPWTRYAFAVGDQAVTVCLPSAPSGSKRSDLGSTHFADFLIATERGQVTVELMGGTSGPFPLEANLPTKTSTDELLQKETISPERWLFSSRERKDGAPRVTSRIPDAYGEDMICMAGGSATHDAAELAAGLAILDRVCRSMAMVSTDAANPLCK